MLSILVALGCLFQTAGAVAPEVPQVEIPEAEVQIAEEPETAVIEAEADAKPLLSEHPTLIAMLDASNGIRANRSLSPHTLNENLCQAAQNHAQYMANGGSFSHGSNGGYQGRARQFGYSGSVRENIAYGQSGVGSVFSTWRNSGGHYASIVSGTSEAGFGLAYSGGTPYWVGVYGSPSSGVSEGGDYVSSSRGRRGRRGNRWGGRRGGRRRG